MRLTPTLELHQIYFDEATRQRIEPGFLPLANISPQYPEFYEAWVIYQYFEKHSISDSTLYGFFSTRLPVKTRLGYQDLVRAVDRNGRAHDVYLVDYAWDQIAYFQNPFEQGDFWHSDITLLAQDFLNSSQIAVDLKALYCTTQTFAFCNHIIATGTYWKEWLALFQRVLHLYTSTTDFRSRLYAKAKYLYKEAFYAAFLQERLPALIIDQRYNTCRIHGLLDTPLEMIFPAQEGLVLKLAHCDWAKQYWIDSGLSVFRDTYNEHKRTIKTAQPSMVHKR